MLPPAAAIWLHQTCHRAGNCWLGFRPFIEHLASSTLSPKTIRKHVDNLWMLGGEIIRDLNDTPSLRKVAAERLLRNVVHVDGGPLIHNGSEEEQLSLDSTCRKLHRFLSEPVPGSYPRIHGRGQSF